MKTTRHRMHSRGWRALLLAVVGALVLTACSSDGDDDPAADEPTEEATSDGGDDGTDEEEDTGDDEGDEGEDTTAMPEVCQGQDGSGLTVGFGNLGESVPFAVTVREGIERVADECGLEIVNADNQLDPQIAQDNARNFMTQGVDGVIEFQVVGDISASLCEILGDTPVIAIDIDHPECAVFMGADNRTAGELAGEGVGQVAQERWGCEVDRIVTFEGFGVGDVNVARMNGSIAGLQSVCPDLELGDFEEWSPEVADSIITRLDADRVDPAFEQGRDFLTANPDADQIVALCINDDSCLGFLSAVEEAGREGQVLFGSQGADQSVWETVAGNEDYIGSTAYFPERYGELLVPNIIRMINGEGPESDPLLVDHEFLTSENIGDYYDVQAGA